jgi:hypothetical protein
MSTPTADVSVPGKLACWSSSEPNGSHAVPSLGAVVPTAAVVVEAIVRGGAVGGAVVGTAVVDTAVVDVAAAEAEVDDDESSLHAELSTSTANSAVVLMAA